MIATFEIFEETGKQEMEKKNGRKTDACGVPM